MLIIRPTTTGLSPYSTSTIDQVIIRRFCPGSNNSRNIKKTTQSCCFNFHSQLPLDQLHMDPFSQFPGGQYTHTTLHTMFHFLQRKKGLLLNWKEMMGHARISEARKLAWEWEKLLPRHLFLIDLHPDIYCPDFYILKKGPVFCVFKNNTPSQLHEFILNLEFEPENILHLYYAQISSFRILNLDST